MQNVAKVSGLGVILIGTSIVVTGTFFNGDSLSGIQIALTIWFFLTGALLAARRLSVLWAHSVIVVLALLWATAEGLTSSKSEQLFVLIALVILIGIYLLVLWAIGGFPFQVPPVAPRTSAAVLSLLLVLAAAFAVSFGIALV